MFRFLFLVAFLFDSSKARIGPDGKCSIYMFAPFSLDSGEEAAGLFFVNETNTGFSQMAAGLLAAKHFNERNASVVWELGNNNNSSNSKFVENCTVTIDVENSRVVDTSPNSHDASRTFMASLLRQQQDWNISNSYSNPNIPCAIAGPFSDAAAIDLSVLAHSLEIPMVATRSLSLFVAQDTTSPYSASVFPDVTASAQRIVEYLQFSNRTNFIALLHDISDTGNQRREALGLELDQAGMRWTSAAYSTSMAIESRTPSAALRRIRASGFRTIVITMGSANFDESLTAIADAAEELGMNNGEYFYIWYDFDVFETFANPQTVNVSKIQYGSAILIPFSYDIADPEEPFLRSWFDQGGEFANLVNSKNPKMIGEAGYHFADADYFRRVVPEYGAAFMYDAVMTIGLAACRAQYHASLEQKGDGNKTAEVVVSGWEHNQAVRQTRFSGPTGLVEFGSDSFVASATRRSDTVIWAALNFLPAPAWVEVTEIRLPFFDDAFVNINPFVYAGNSTIPPLPLRDPPPQNYLGPAQRVFGFVLMGMTNVFGLMAVVWIAFRRQERIFRAAQPAFLICICLGSIIQSLAIIPISLDESHELSSLTLSQSCMAIPWLLSLGHITIYSALFTKLWRVNKVLHFARGKISAKHVAAPMALLLLAALVVLVLWTVLDGSLEWVRTEINPVTGESIGACESDRAAAFVSPLIFLMIVPTILTAFMSHKTKSVDDAYTERSWIFVMIVVQVEVTIVGAPTVVLLNSESTTIRHLGFLFLIWTFPMTTLLFIILPKLIADVRGTSAGTETTGKSQAIAAEQKRVHFSGIRAGDAVIPSAMSSITTDEPKEPSPFLAKIQAHGLEEEAKMAGSLRSSGEIKFPSLGGNVSNASGIEMKEPSGLFDIAEGGSDDGTRGEQSLGGFTDGFSLGDTEASPHVNRALLYSSAMPGKPLPPSPLIGEKSTDTDASQTEVSSVPTVAT